MFEWQLHVKVPGNLQLGLSSVLVSHKGLMRALFYLDQAGVEGPPRSSETLVCGKQQPIISALAADEILHTPYHRCSEVKADVDHTETEPFQKRDFSGVDLLDLSERCK